MGRLHHGANGEGGGNVSPSWVKGLIDSFKTIPKLKFLSSFALLPITVSPKILTGRDPENVKIIHF